MESIHWKEKKKKKKSSTPFSLPFLLLPLLTLTSTFPSPSLSLTTDGLSLLAFKSAVATSNRNLTLLSSWSESDTSPCSWEGVNCDTLHRVTTLSLPNLSLSGYLPSELGLLSSLLTLNLPSNNLSGTIPTQLRSLNSLTFLDLSHNSLSGPIPTDLAALQRLTHLDLSSNLLTGSVPPSLASLPNLSGVLNLSFNSLSGHIPAAFGNLPVTLSLDLRSNNLSGEIPQTSSLLNQGPTAFSGNPDLCGFPLKHLCPQISDPTHIPLPNATPDLTFPSPLPSAAAAAAAKKKPTTVLAIPILAGVLAFAFLSVLLLQWKLRRGRRTHLLKSSGKEGKLADEERRDGHGNGGTGGEIFVAVDESFGLELEELLRASAYVIGKSRSGIVYRVVVGRGGAAVAVRRLSEADDVTGAGTESAWRRRRDFESDAMAIGRAKHPNVVSLRAYYYAPDEKLLVYDYIAGGSLHGALHGPRAASLDWAARLKILQGAARGLSYLHELSPRKPCHGSLKSTKVLLDEDLHPYVSGFGLNRKGVVNHFAGSMSGYVAPELRGGGGGGNQKGDVYAFGLVMMEVLTGRGSEELEGFVRRAFVEERPMSEIVDPVLLREVHAKKQVIAVFHLALACTELDPDARPRMRAVSESLDRIGGPS